MYLSEEQTYTSVLQKSIVSLMDGVSTSDFSSWSASSARRRLSDGDLRLLSDVDLSTRRLSDGDLSTRRLSDGDLSTRRLSDGDLIIPEYSEVRMYTQSAAVSITYVITVVNSNYNYDTLTGQLNSGLSAGR